MILFHGSSVPGISTLRPFASNHDKPYVYLTHSKILATLYAYNPMKRPNGFFTYWWDKDGILCYDEYFNNQMEEIYAGQKGFVYACQGDYPQLGKMPWVYLSEDKVHVEECTEVPDIYAQLLDYENKGLLRVRRWKNASERQREIWKKVVHRSLTDVDRNSPIVKEYIQFVYTHFPDLI